MTVRVIACGGGPQARSALVDRLRRDAPALLTTQSPARDVPIGDLAIAASTADAAIVLVDGTRGLSADARRQITLLSLMDIRELVVAIDGVDAAGRDAARFGEIEREVHEHAQRAGRDGVPCIPIVASTGINVRSRDGAMPWYDGPTLIGRLQSPPSGPASPVASPVETAEQFDATIAWMSGAPLLPGRGYLMRIAGTTITARVGRLKHRLDLETLGRMAATQLSLDDVGQVELALDQRIAFHPGTAGGATPGFVLVDHITAETVAAGVLRFALRRSADIKWQAVDVDKAHRSALNGHRPAVVWLTGLPGAGKSTVANLVDLRLNAIGAHAYVLDGDNVRHGLSRDLGFTAADRVENVRRAGEVARLMVDAGLIVIASFISPYRSDRRSIRDLLDPGEFYEVFVDTPQAVAEARDRKGLYAKARRGELENFTGVDAPYEPPEGPELRIDTTAIGADEAAAQVIAMLIGGGVLSS